MNGLQASRGDINRTSVTITESKWSFFITGDG